MPTQLRVWQAHTLINRQKESTARRAGADCWASISAESFALDFVMEFTGLAQLLEADSAVCSKWVT